MPITVTPREIVITMKDPSVSFRAQNGRRIVRKVPGHIWSGTFIYPVMTKESFAPVRGFLASLRGTFNTFTTVPPNLANPSGTQLVNTNIAANKATGSTSIDISAGTSGNTFLAGDVIKFSNHTKVYMVTTDVTIAGDGTATLDIVPPLITAITTSHQAQHKDVPFTVALINDVQEMKTTVTDLYKYEVDFEEVF